MTEPDGVNQGPGQISTTIAAQIRAFRLRRGWSVRQLAEECAKHGAPQLTEASLGNIERGQDPDAKRKPRDITVEELLILAYVLNVRPAELIFDPGSEKVSVTPSAKVHPYLAWAWLVGLSPHAEIWGEPVRSHEQLGPPHYFQGWLNVDAAVVDVEIANQIRIRTEKEGEPEDKVKWGREHYATTIRRLGLFLDDIFTDRDPRNVPPLPSWIVDDLREAEANDLIKMLDERGGPHAHPRRDSDGWVRARLPKDLPVFEQERPT